MQETQETRVWSLGGEDTLEEGMATHSSSLAWRIPWTEEPEQLNTGYYDSYQKMKCYVSRSVMSDSLQSNGL